MTATLLRSVITATHPLRYHTTADHRYAFLVREGTFDASIVHMVYDNDEYQLPTAPSERAAVLDIGAHIGAFSMLAAQRGYLVHAYEANLLNYQLLVTNTQPSSVILPFFAAVIGCHPQETTTLYRVPMTFVRDQHMDNTGGMAAHPVQTSATANEWHTASELYVPSLSFDAAMQNLLTTINPEYIVVKMDCEGAEDAIFCTSSMIAHADLILAEYHLGQEAAARYEQRLRTMGYDVVVTPVNRFLGYIRAVAQRG